jgi:hypothetical protein
MDPTRRRAYLAVLLLLAVVLLWGTPVVYPLKILVVFFHELGHGLAAVATGGSIVEILLEPEEGGLALTRGGNRFLVLSAGYLGSLLLGGLLLLAAARSRRDHILLAVLGGLLVLLTLLLVRPWFGFGMVFGLAAGAAMLALAEWGGRGVADVLLELIGLTSCLYAVLDIKSDVLDRPELRSDARLLAEHTGLPTLLWGLLWIVVAAAGAWGFFRRALRMRAEGADRLAAARRAAPDHGA